MEGNLISGNASKRIKLGNNSADRLCNRRKNARSENEIYKSRDKLLKDLEVKASKMAVSDVKMALRYKPAKSLVEFSMEKISRMASVAMKLTAAKVCKETEQEKKKSVKLAKSIPMVDNAIRQLADFIFPNLTQVLAMEFVVSFAQRHSRQMMKLATIHVPEKENCKVCIWKFVTIRFTRFFLDERVQKLDTNIFPEISEIQILKEFQSSGSKKIVNIRGTYLPMDESFFIRGLGNMSTLRSLQFNFFCSEDILFALGRCCPLLEQIDVRKSYGIRDTGFSRLMNGCKNLKRIIFKQKTAITTDTYVKALHTLSELETLDVQDGIFKILISAFHATPDLRLNLRSIFNTVDETIGEDFDVAFIAQHCPKLRKISLFVMGQNLKGLKSLKHLESVHILGAKLGPHYEHELFEHSGHQITTIELRNVSEIDQFNLTILGEQCPNLKTLILASCTFLGKADIFDDDKIYFPSLEVFYIGGNEVTSRHFTETRVDHLVTLVLYNAPNMRELYVNIGGMFQLTDETIDFLICHRKLKELRTIQISAQFCPYLIECSARKLLCFAQNLEEIGDLTCWNINLAELMLIEVLVFTNNLNRKISNKRMINFYKKVIDSRPESETPVFVM